MINPSYTTEDPGNCRTCNNSFEWHKDNNPIHPFNDGSAGATAFLKAGRGERDRRGTNVPQETTQRVQYPFDPVLRMALMNKGVISPADLTQAEEMLSATSAELRRAIEESRNGE
jgi:hypothetical protein